MKSILKLIPPKIQLIDKEFIDKNINESTSIIVNTDSAYSYISDISDKDLKLDKHVISSSNMIELSQKAYDKKIFEDIAYVEPMYIKKPYVN